MTDSVSFGWDWNRREYLAAERETWALSPARPRAARRRVLLSGLGFALFAAAYASRGILTLRTALVLALLTFGLPWLGARVGEWVLPRLRARQFARACLPAYGHTAATLGPSGLTLTWQDSSVQLGWPTFLRAAETPGFILLYQSPKSSIYLPKRAVPPEHLETVQTIVRRGTGERGSPVPTAAA